MCIIRLANKSNNYIKVQKLITTFGYHTKHYAELAEDIEIICKDHGVSIKCHKKC